MRTSVSKTASFIFAFALISAAGAAHAGTIGFMNGQPSWQTSCAEPQSPMPVSSVGSEAEAELVNARMGQYNQYATAMQGYMDCVSDESQTDQSATSRAIAASAQRDINQAQEKVTALGIRAQQRPQD